MKTIKIILPIILVAVLGTFLFDKYEKKRDEQALSEALGVFDTYLKSAEANDLESLKLVSYQLSDTCKDESKRDECNVLMTSAYSFGIEIERETLSVLNSDKKQIILANEYIESLEGPAPAIIRASIYFVRDGDTLKLLSLNPYDGAFIIKQDEATSTLSMRLKEMVVDSDLDGLPDRVENCGDDTAPLLGCVPTNPDKKDSDGDSLWDSTESFLYKKEE